MSIAGPGHIQFGSDGSVTLVSTGPALLFSLFRGTPGITLLNGRFVWSFDAQGNETSFSSVGTTRDLCADSPARAPPHQLGRAGRARSRQTRPALPVASKGLSARQIADAMGHKKTSTTEIHPALHGEQADERIRQAISG